MKISLVVNTLNEEENIRRCLESARSLVDEIVIVDMESSDKTCDLARQFTNKIFSHPKLGYVEPARNFAIEKASGEWILILDADETISSSLGSKLKEIAQMNECDYVRLPRKNLVFDKWLMHTGWWPDYKIRFFKKGMVSWNEEIHSVPLTYGTGFDLPATEENAIIHYNYSSISQFLERLNRYTDQQTKELLEGNYVFAWQDLIRRPTNEFLSRFFSWEGYKDGLHGFILSSLQAISSFVTYLKAWESQKFPQKDDILDDVSKEIKKSGQDYKFWFWEKSAKRQNVFSKLLYKTIQKLDL